MTAAIRNGESDRRHISLSSVVTLFMLALQLAALVWGAATLSAAVKGLQAQVEQISSGLTTMNANISGLTVDVRVLQSKQR